MEPLAIGSRWMHTGTGRSDVKATGGDLSQPQWVTEQYILDLELEEAGKLIVEPKTQERVMAILQTGKRLRN